MTTGQRSELDKAIARATAAGVEVCGHGHMRGTHDRLFCVASQRDENHWHIVRLVNGSRLVCDCPSHVICVHRAACHMELVVEAARREYDAAQVTSALELETQDRRESEQAATRAAKREAAVLLSSNWAFSLFK
jgi:hypothetical protein